jgi:hypothetical protein
MKYKLLTGFVMCLLLLNVVTALPITGPTENPWQEKSILDGEYIKTTYYHLYYYWYTKGNYKEDKMSLWEGGAEG